MALALPVFRMDRFAGVRPMRWLSSREVIFRLASITSRFTMIGMGVTSHGQVIFFPDLHGGGHDVCQHTEDQGQEEHDDAHKNDGTMSLAGALGSYPFLPKEVEQSVNYHYTLLDGKLVGKYGLYDSYNLEKGRIWVANDVIGIDKGISLLMIENYRSELVWKYFMQSEYIQTAIDVLGFKVKEAAE